MPCLYKKKTMILLATSMHSKNIGGGGCKLRLGVAKFHVGGANATSKEYKVPSLVPTALCQVPGAPCQTANNIRGPHSAARFSGLLSY